MEKIKLLLPKLLNKYFLTVEWDAHSGKKDKYEEDLREVCIYCGKIKFEHFKYSNFYKFKTYTACLEYLLNEVS